MGHIKQKKPLIAEWLLKKLQLSYLRSFILTKARGAGPV